MRISRTRAAACPLLWIRYQRRLQASAKSRLPGPRAHLGRCRAAMVACIGSAETNSLSMRSWRAARAALVAPRVWSPPVAGWHGVPDDALLRVAAIGSAQRSGKSALIDGAGEMTEGRRARGRIPSFETCQRVRSLATVASWQLDKMRASRFVVVRSALVGLPGCCPRWPVVVRGRSHRIPRLPFVHSAS